jgi:nucleoid-associated protein YgaU
VTPTAPVAATSAASQDPQFWYTVKENDSLWSIAADQLGNGSAWTAIKELNADVLKGSESIHPNMKLRLPAKPLASAQ